MKFALSLSLLALVAQQAVAIALPVNDELTAELAARHHPGGARVRSDFRPFRSIVFMVTYVIDHFRVDKAANSEVASRAKAATLEQARAPQLQVPVLSQVLVLPSLQVGARVLPARPRLPSLARRRPALLLRPPRSRLQPL